jgi:cell division protein FtsW
MLRITRGEESKLTSWYFEIDRRLLGYVLILVFIGAITMISAGSAQAARMIPPQPWFYFIQKAMPAYLLGLVCLFGFGMLNKKQVIRVSVVGLIIGLIGLVLTIAHPMVVKGSRRWANLGGLTFMPADILKPAFIMLTAWFLAKMHKVYGSDIFLNKNAWKINKISWWPYLILFAICIFIIFRHPDVGNSLLYVCVLFVMLFVAGLPWKLIPAMLGVLALMAAAAFAVMPHVRARAAQMFTVAPRTQVWYSLNSIKHGGLFGSGDESYVKDVLPESTNDFVYSAIAEDWGAIGACLLVVLLFLILNTLIKHATYAKDDFVIYAIAGAAALFGGQICFNLMTALHLFINKGMTLPFVSYGGVSFITYCVLFGMILALIREDTWNK